MATDTNVLSTKNIATDGHKPAGGRIALYETNDELRVAYKLLTNHGVAPHRMHILCNDRERRRELIARLMPPDGPRDHTDPTTLGAAGSLTGLGILGGAGLIVGWPIAVVGASLGAVIGGALGVVMSADTHNDETANEVFELYEKSIRDGAVGLVVVAHTPEEVAGLPAVEQLLQQAGAADAGH